MNNKQKVRTRFCPSPTGQGMHVGGVRTALYNYLFAKKHGGEFIYKLDDTDRDRFVETAEKQYSDTFKWLGIEFDESPEKGGKYAPYRQTERKDEYLKYALKLVEDGFAYYAFDTSEELNAAKENDKFFAYNYESRMVMKNSLTLPKEDVEELLKTRNDWTIRIKYPDTPTKIDFSDEIRGDVSFMTDQLDDKVLYKKKDDIGTYHLCSVVDDKYYDITHVIRAEEWLPSTPLHCYLYDCLGWDRPIFAHLPLVLGPDGKKLSKRDSLKYGIPIFGIGYTDSETGEFIKGYKEEGFVPSAVINLLALIGWNGGSKKEIYTLDDLINEFDLSRVNKAGGKINIVKSKWFNSQHLRSIDAKEILPLVKDDFSKRGVNLPDETLLKVISDNKGKIDSVNKLYDVVSYLFNKPTEYDKKALKKWRDDSSDTIQNFVNEIISIDDWSEENIHKTFENYVNSNEIKFGLFAPLIRVFLTGRSNGPSMFSIMEIIGKQDTIDRLCTYEVPSN